jgi:hypothetical protein
VYRSKLAEKNPMKTILLTFIFSIATLGVNAQSLNPSWQYIVNELSYTPEFSKPHPSGGVFVAWTNDQFNVVCYLLNSSGITVWSHVYDHGQCERVVDIETDQSGNCYLLINTEALNQVNLGQDIIVCKYDATGNLAYSSVYDHNDSFFSNENDEASDFTLDVNGNIYVVGKHFHGACTLAESWTLRFKMDSSGNVIWSHGDVNGSLDATSVCLSSFGRLYMPAIVSLSPGNVVAQVREIDVNSGSVLAAGNLTYNNAVDGLRYPVLNADPFGNLYVRALFISGNFSNQPNSTYLAKVSPNCQEIWSDTLNDSYQTRSYVPTELFCDQNGDLFLAHNCRNGFYYGDAHVLKLNSSGQILWDVLLGVPGELNQCWDLDITPSGDILAAVSSVDTSLNGGTTLYRLDNNSGSVQWFSNEFLYGSMNFPRGKIATVNTGDVYITGYADQETYTIKFGNAAVGVNDMNLNQSDITILSEPNSSYSIVSGDEISAMEIYNAAGQLVSSCKPMSFIVHVNLQGNPQGIYLCHLLTAQHERKVTKLMRW